MTTLAAWTADELIEALHRCHRTDAPVWFKYGHHDLHLLRVTTEGGEIQVVFDDPDPGLDLLDDPRDV